MNFSFFFAKRLAGVRNFSGQASAFILVNTFAIAFSLSILLLTDGITNGFRSVVHEKMTSFWGHIHIQAYKENQNSLTEEAGFLKSSELESSISKIPNVDYLTAYATKYGLIFSKTESEGVLFKGIEKEYQNRFISSFLKEGKGMEFIDSSKPAYEILLSKSLSKKLKTSVGEEVICNFFDNLNQQRKRKLLVSGIFETGIEEYDNNYAIVDLQLIQKMNSWGEKKIGGYEVFLNDIHQLDSTNNRIFYALPDLMTTRTIQELFPQLFDWLNLIELNKILIFVIMFVVSTMNIITCLLILITDKTRLIAVLFSVGTKKWEVQKIFIYLTALLSLFGIILGNIISLSILFLQKHYHWISLDPKLYVADHVPIEFNIWNILLINFGIFFISIFSLILPSLFVRKMSISEQLTLE